MKKRSFKRYRKALDAARAEHVNHETWSEQYEEGVVRLDPRERALSILSSRDIVEGCYVERPTNIHPTNAARAQTAREALDYYAFLEHADPYTGSDTFSVTYDLLSDLMHLCHQEGINIEGIFEAVRDDRFERELADPKYENDD